MYHRKKRLLVVTRGFYTLTQIQDFFVLAISPKALDFIEFTTLLKSPIIIVSDSQYYSMPFQTKKLPGKPSRPAVIM